MNLECFYLFILIFFVFFNFFMLFFTYCFSFESNICFMSKKLTIEQKKKIIDAAKHNNNQRQLARDFTKEFGHNVDHTTISKILKPENKRKIEEAIQAGINPKQNRIQEGKHFELEKALAVWIKQFMAADPNNWVTGETIIVCLLLKFLFIVLFIE